MNVFGGGCRLIFVVVIVAFTVKVFRAFVFMGRSKLQEMGRVSCSNELSESEGPPHILISSERLSHVTGRKFI